MPEDGRRTVLSVADLSVVRGGRAVLQGVTFDARAGDLIAVVGPNGAGKSTLFGALLGLLPPAHGDFRAPGGLSFVPQSAPRERAFPVNVLEVALMGAYARAGLFGRVGEDEREHALAALALVGLDDAERPYEQLSAGQRRRALVARALVQGGSVMLLDEPFSDVDAVSEQRITSVLDEQRSAGRAIVIVDPRPRLRDPPRHSRAASERAGNRFRPARRGLDLADACRRLRGPPDPPRRRCRARNRRGRPSRPWHRPAGGKASRRDPEGRVRRCSDRSRAPRCSAPSRRRC